MSSNDPSTFQVPDNPGSEEVAKLIRSKLDSIYGNEPDAVGEAIESVQKPAIARSRHQKFMAELAASGKHFTQIQTEWHDYYQGLSDKEKHEVWNEFYAANGAGKPVFRQQAKAEVPAASAQASGGAFHGSFDVPAVPAATKGRKRAETVADIKKHLTSRVRVRGKLSRRQHLKSLAFGLGIGAFTVLLLLFGLFNERFIAPFITPSRTVSSTPLILDENSAVGPDPKLIIPKINLEAPVVYDIQTIEEDAVQAGLDRGVVHYATTPNPGELGNGAIFGHSSHNIFHKGKYKFVFVLLNRLETGDTFYLEKDGIRYVYRVFDKKVVTPQQVDVLNAVPGKASTMTLITCDPPGTATNRLVVWGEQISPDPTKNGVSTALQTDEKPEQLTSNSRSMWSSFWNWVF